MGEFDFPDNYDVIMAARKAALVARQDALVEYDDTPTEDEAIALIRDAADSAAAPGASHSWFQFALNNDYDMKIVSDLVGSDPSALEVEYTVNLERSAPVLALVPTLWVTAGDSSLVTVDHFDELAEVGGLGVFEINRPGLVTVRLFAQVSPSELSSGPPAEGGVSASVYVSRSLAGEAFIPSVRCQTTVSKSTVPQVMYLTAEVTTWVGPENFFTEEGYQTKPYFDFGISAGDVEAGYYDLQQVVLTMEIVESL